MLRIVNDEMKKKGIAANDHYVKFGVVLSNGMKSYFNTNYTKETADNSNGGGGGGSALSDGDGDEGRQGVDIPKEMKELLPKRNFELI